MKNSLLELLESMRASRGALERELDRLAMRPRPGALTLLKANATPKRIGIAIGFALAVAVLFPARRRH
jgi:hypothetical protein